MPAPTDRRWIGWALLAGAAVTVLVAQLDDDEADGAEACNGSHVLAVTTGWDFPAVWVFDGSDGHPLVPDEVSAAASFSPDGSEVATVRAEGDYESSGPDATELWVVSTDDGDRRVVTGSEAIIASPDWSPDGTTIAYTDNPNLGYRDLRTVPASGGEPTIVLTLDDDEVEVREPAWSPDGSTIAYVTSEGDVGMVARDGQDPRIVASIPYAETVDWSPDGELLVVGTYLNMEAGELLLLDVRTGDTTLLTDQAGQPSWAADGTVFHFQRTDGEWRLARSTIEGDHLVFGGYLDEIEDAAADDGIHPYIPIDSTCRD